MDVGKYRISCHLSGMWRYANIMRAPLKWCTARKVLIMSQCACAARAYGSLPVSVSVCVFQLYLFLP